MMTESGEWLLCLLVPAGGVALISCTKVEVERLRRFAVAASLLSLGLCGVVFAALEMSPPWPIASGAAYGSLLRVDHTSAVLLPFASALWLLTVAVTPRAVLDRGGLRRTALATAVNLACFMTESPVLLVLLWAASVVILILALGARAHRHTRRVVAAYLGGSTLALAVGSVLLHLPGARGTVSEVAGMTFLLVAVLIRKGIAPFHAWVPEIFENGRLGPAILFSTPQLGAYVALVLILPRAPSELLRIMSVLALCTAVYGAALALVQVDARRACGYLFVSQSALVMAGFGAASAVSLAGGLCLWLSSGLAFAALARCVLVLESRRGRLDLSLYHGGYERMPMLAASFLLVGLVCTGFPGTFGFVGAELLVDGVVGAFPVLGFAVVLAGALTGVAIMRMYFSLFCGRRDDSVHLRILGRESWAFGSLVALLVGMGLAPGPMVRSRLSASEKTLELRVEVLPIRGPDPPLRVDSSQPERISTSTGFPGSPFETSGGRRRDRLAVE